jgi:hypothetical protein
MTTTDPKTKAATVEMLRTRSVTAVSDDTGFSTATLWNWAKAAGIKPPDGRANWRANRVEKPRATAAPPQDEPMAKKKAKKKRRRKAAPTAKAAAAPLLDAALADIERAGKSIRALQEAYRKVFGG